MQNAASSVNSQPWHYVIATSAAGKAKIAQSTQGSMSYNAPKVLNASHTVVFCRRTVLTTDHAEAVLHQESLDGRYKDEEAINVSRKTRNYYFGQHNDVTHDSADWMAKQVYLSFGMVMMAAAAMDIDTCPMEGFDAAVLDQVLGLKARGLSSVLLLALGYHAHDDFNKLLPKSRLKPEQIFTRI